jgi:acyl-CoA synthetase (AMP-forming)/AMP-acid ligase II
MCWRHAGVVEVAVVGATDDRLGQRVVAVVVATATAEELDAHCLGSELARFKRPQSIASSTSCRSRRAARSSGANYERTR